MSRLNEERQKKLEPQRIAYCKGKLEEMGYVIRQETDRSLKFLHRGNLITFFPYSGWHSGKGIVDGRGFKELVKKLQPNNSL